MRIPMQSSRRLSRLDNLRALALAKMAALLLTTPLLAQPEAFVFHAETARPGLASDQRLECLLDLEMAIRQSGQVVQSRKQMITRQQARKVTILSVGKTAPSRATVHYQKSTIKMAAADQQRETSQPVEGKTYLISRTGPTLNVHYPDGSDPTAEELAIVTQGMSSFGLANPIAKFFDGRTVKLGEQLDLPVGLARDLVGFARTGNNVSRFQLKLQSVTPDGADDLLATFEIQMEAEDPAQTGVSLQLVGTMVLEVDTCRAREVQMTGPVAASEMFGPENAQYEVYSRGDINVAVRNQTVR